MKLSASTWMPGAVVLLATLGIFAAEPAWAQPAMRTSVSRFGITWTFDQPRLTGQFVNGDWWVVGPTTVVSVSPGPRSAAAGGADEPVRWAYIADYINQFGDTAFQNNTARRNGSMINPTWGGYQGYDSGGKNYSSSLSRTFPRTLSVNQSLISTISHTSLPNSLLIPFYSDDTDTLLRTAAILTCLASQPPDDAFRPPYAGSSKPIYRASDLRRDLLPSLAPVANTPSLSQMERWVERPWLDHVSSWMMGATSPNENMAHYGREYARGVSMVGLRLMLNDSLAAKETLLIRFVQLGIDLQGIRVLGAKWQMGGGNTSGRKWPILFAGVLLGDSAMSTFPGNSEFHEDQQTYWGTGWAGQTVLWQMINHHGVAPTYEERHPSTWDSMDWRSSGYRHCCNALSWIGEAMGALLLGAKQNWNHDQFFDYCDRWMTEDQAPYAAAGVSTQFCNAAFDPFVDNMYWAYRNSVPAQPGATNNMKWVYPNWVADINPNAVTADAGPDQTIDDTDGNGFEIVTLDGGGSYASSGTITGYLWSRDGSYVGSSAVVATALPLGVHTLTLQVTADTGQTDVDTVQITVKTPDIVAVAGDDVEVTDADDNGFELVLLDGTDSYHVQYAITDYLWTEGQSYISSDAFTLAVFPVGAHTVTLRVTASNGDQATDTVQITVSPAPDKPGDADGDGDVDLDDFLALKVNFGSDDATWAEGDFDGDHDVDLDDFIILKVNFGT